MGCFPFILTHEDSFGPGWSHQPGPKTPLIRVGATNRDQRGIKDLFRPLAVGTGTKDTFSSGSNTSRDKCEGPKIISVVVD